MFDTIGNGSPDVPTEVKDLDVIRSYLSELSELQNESEVILSYLLEKLFGEAPLPAEPRPDEPLLKGVLPQCAQTAGWRVEHAYRVRNELLHLRNLLVD